MSRSRKLLWLPALYFAVALHAQVVTSEAMLPLNGTFSISSGQFHDLVNLSGSMHLVTQVASPDSPPIAPQIQFRAITTLVNVTGTGMITGLQYQATGTSIFASPNPPPIFPARIAFTVSYQMSPLGVIKSAPFPVTPEFTWSQSVSAGLLGGQIRFGDGAAAGTGELVAGRRQCQRRDWGQQWD